MMAILACLSHISMGQALDRYALWAELAKTKAT